MPGFSVLAPLIGSAIKSASDNTNRRKQFEQGNIRNTFSIFTGGPRQNLNGLTANNSTNTLLQGLAGSLNSQQALSNQAAQSRIAELLGARGINPQGQQITLNAPVQTQIPGQNFSAFLPQLLG